MSTIPSTNQDIVQTLNVYFSKKNSFYDDLIEIKMQSIFFFSKQNPEI